jgi:hypothetical protein
VRYEAGAEACVKFTCAVTWNEIPYSLADRNLLPEGQGSMFPNIGSYVPKYMVSHPRRLQS